MREYTERAFGSLGLSIVFVFGFSKSFWLIEEKFSFLQKYNEKKGKEEKLKNIMKKKKSFGFVFLFKINSDLNSYDFFVFNSIFYFFI